MKGIDIKARIKNPVFIMQMILAVLTPILAYAGLTAKDITTWNTLGELLVGAMKNPYILVTVLVSVGNAVNNPTTKGFWDGPYICDGKK